MEIVTLGDLLLDVIVRLEQPLQDEAGSGGGQAADARPENRAAFGVPGADVPASTRVGAGGQAANVAAWAAALGAEARCVATRGDDAAGELVARELAQRGVELAGPVAAGPTGVVVSVVGADGERSLASDRGVAATLAPDDLDAAWLECDVLHVSGYALLREPLAEAALLAARLARAAGARVSVDVAAWTAIRAFGAVEFRDVLDTLAPDVLFATDAEWQILGGAYLTAPTALLKHGARGCTVVTEEARLELAAVPADVVDTTGAGDALAAGFLYGLLGEGGSLEEAARRGLGAAARCVARVGSLP